LKLASLLRVNSRAKWITQCYLPGYYWLKLTFRPLPQPSRAVIRFSNPRWMHRWVNTVGLVTYRGGIPARRWSSGSNWAHCIVTSFMRQRTPPLRQTANRLLKT